MWRKLARFFLFTPQWQSVLVRTGVWVRSVYFKSHQFACGYCRLTQFLRWCWITDGFLCINICGGETILVCFTRELILANRWRRMSINEIESCAVELAKRDMVILTNRHQLSSIFSHMTNLASDFIWKGKLAFHYQLDNQLGNRERQVSGKRVAEIIVTLI